MRSVGPPLVGPVWEVWDQAKDPTSQRLEAIQPIPCNPLSQAPLVSAPIPLAVYRTSGCPWVPPCLSPVISSPKRTVAPHLFSEANRRDLVRLVHPWAVPWVSSPNLPALCSGGQHSHRLKQYLAPRV